MELLKAIAERNCAKVSELFEAWYGFPHDPEKLASVDWPDQLCPRRRKMTDDRMFTNQEQKVWLPWSEGTWFCWLKNRADEWGLTPGAANEDSVIDEVLGCYVRHTPSNSIHFLSGIDRVARQVAHTE